jgi:hypothetical protein
MKKVSDSSIFSYYERLTSDLEKEDILDLGSGGSVGKFVTLDINSGSNPDIHMDFRAYCGIDPYRDDIGKYDKADKLKRGFTVIRAIHFLEHIEWIYQHNILNNIFNLINDSGFLFIEVPNLSYIFNMYNDQIKKRLLKNKSVSFPKEEYPFEDDDKYNIYKWLNFKIFSGCSPNDYHHCAYDTDYLESILLDIGYKNIVMSDSATLKCIARVD